MPSALISKEVLQTLAVERLLLLIVGGRTGTLLVADACGVIIWSRLGRVVLRAVWRCSAGRRRLVSLDALRTGTAWAWRGLRVRAVLVLAVRIVLGRHGRREVRRLLIVMVWHDAKAAGSGISYTRLSTTRLSLSKIEILLAWENVGRGRRL